MRDPRHAAAQYFDQKLLGRLLSEHASGKADHGESLWMLTNVYVWHEAMVEGGVTAAA